MILQLVVERPQIFAVLGFLAFSIYIHFLDQSISLAFDNFALVILELVYRRVLVQSLVYSCVDFAVERDERS